VPKFNNVANIVVHTALLVPDLEGNTGTVGMLYLHCTNCNKRYTI